MTLVSVILPTFNRADFLNNTINSVLDQSFSDFELIVWDDGSADGTKKIIEKYTDSRIKYFYDENHGVAFARNMAIEKANGKFIAFIDSDDIWLPDKLGHQVSLINKHDADFCSGNYINIIEETGEKEVINHFGFHGKILSEQTCRGLQIASIFLCNQSIITIPSILCKTELFFNYGFFNETLRNSEDKELYWRFILSDIKFIFSDQLLYYRVKLDQSLEDYSIEYHENQIKSLNLMYQESEHLTNKNFDKIFNDRLSLYLKRYLSKFEENNQSILKHTINLLKNYQIIRINLMTLISMLLRQFKYRLSNKRGNHEIN